MMIIYCDACGGLLEEPGALLFGVPYAIEATGEANCTKMHLCEGCFILVELYIQDGIN